MTAHGHLDAYRCDSDGPFHSDERWRADRVIPKTPKSVWAQYGWTREGGWPSGEALLRFLKRT